MEKAKRIKYSPDFVREQSRQNLGKMARMIDKLYARANTPEAREVLKAMQNAIESIRPTGVVVPAVLDVEKLFTAVIKDYNENLEIASEAGIDTATIAIINSIVAERSKMCDNAMDADEKRGWKTYRKINKGLGTKKELRARYSEQYAESMEEIENSRQRAETLGQLVGSYQLTISENTILQEVDALDEQIRQLATQYKAATDQAVRDRLNTRYRQLLEAKESKETALAQIQMKREELADVDSLLEQLKIRSKLDKIGTRTAEELKDLSDKVSAGLKKAQRTHEAAREAVGGAKSAMRNLRNSASASANRGATLDEVVLREQSASLDDITGAGQAGVTAQMPTLDDIIGSN